MKAVLIATLLILSAHAICTNEPSCFVKRFFQFQYPSEGIYPLSTFQYPNSSIINYKAYGDFNSDLMYTPSYLEPISLPFRTTTKSPFWFGMKNSNYTSKVPSSTPPNVSSTISIFVWYSSHCRRRQQRRLFGHHCLGRKSQFHLKLPHSLLSNIKRRRIRHRSSSNHPQNNWPHPYVFRF